MQVVVSVDEFPDHPIFTLAIKSAGGEGSSYSASHRFGAIREVDNAIRACAAGKIMSVPFPRNYVRNVFAIKLGSAELEARRRGLETVILISASAFSI